MGEKPLKTLNLIGKLMSVIDYSPSSTNASSSMSSAAEDHQLHAAAAALTLHQSCLQPPPSNVYKRKAEAPVASPASPKGDLVAEYDDDDDQSRPRLTTGTGRPSDHRVHDHVQVVGDPALYEIKKKLKPSDVGHLSRLLVPKEMVKKHVLPFVDVEFVQRVGGRDGAIVTVLDTESKTDHQLTFRYLKSSKSYVFNGNWNKDFVNRRELKEDDEIGLHWDSSESKFHFSRLKLASQESRGADYVSKIL